MSKFFLAPNVQIELIPSVAPFGDAKLIVASNGSLAATGRILTQANGTIATLVSETIGGEPWFTEESEFFRFDHSRQLHSVILGVPDENAQFDGLIPQAQEGYFSLRLSPDVEFFTVPVQSCRSFDPVRRELHCFTKNDTAKTVVRITQDLSLIFNMQNVLSGWVLSSPLESIAESFQGEKDPEPVDDHTYRVYADFFEIFSDNESLAFDYENELMVEKLLEVIDSRRIFEVKGQLRRRLLEESLGELRSHYLER
ncbi:hypothetical protein [Massilia aquatica]|uniref:Uncharacterized protein n=1 Tax=Massilia aquatica TaxID=2609000 RepID=A0ABX0MDE9_9BURK|nr:hypothetical protein [Massilia aquatica]NHZ42963.1 hypothetical protein [Massilia aquatica]